CAPTTSSPDASRKRGLAGESSRPAPALRPASPTIQTARSARAKAPAEISVDEGDASAFVKTARVDRLHSSPKGPADPPIATRPKRASARATIASVWRVIESDAVAFSATAPG